MHPPLSLSPENTCTDTCLCGLTIHSYTSNKTRSIRQTHTRIVQPHNRTRREAARSNEGKGQKSSHQQSSRYERTIFISTAVSEKITHLPLTKTLDQDSHFHLALQCFLGLSNGVPFSIRVHLPCMQRKCKVTPAHTRSCPGRIHSLAQYTKQCMHASS